MNFKNIMMGGIVVTVVLLLISYFLLPVTQDLQTDTFTDNTQKHTGGGETSVDVTLTHSHFYDTSQHMSVTSTEQTDTAAITDYNDSTDVVTIGGLVSNATRMLAVTYEIESEDNQMFTGFTTILWLIPAFLILGILWGIIRSFWS